MVSNFSCGGLGGVPRGNGDRGNWAGRHAACPPPPPPGLLQEKRRAPGVSARRPSSERAPSPTGRSGNEPRFPPGRRLGTSREGPSSGTPPAGGLESESKGAGPGGADRAPRGPRRDGARRLRAGGFRAWPASPSVRPQPRAPRPLKPPRAPRWKGRGPLWCEGRWPFQSQAKHRGLKSWVSG